MCLAWLLAVCGIYCAFAYHSEKAIPHFYSLHAWIGLLVIAAFSGQLAFGVCAYLLDLVSQETKRSAMRWHRFVGIFVVFTSLANVTLGILDKNHILVLALKVGNYDPAVVTGNAVGLLVVTTSLFVGMALHGNASSISSTRDAVDPSEKLPLTTGPGER